MNTDRLKDLKCFALWLSILYVFATLFVEAFAITPWLRDDSDAQRWFAPRSHLTPRLDRATGCQYLEDGRGGLTPRLDANGRAAGCGTL